MVVFFVEWLVYCFIEGFDGGFGFFSNVFYDGVYNFGFVVVFFVMNDIFG